MLLSRPLLSSSPSNGEQMSSYIAVSANTFLLILIRNRNSSGTKYFGGHSDLLCGVLVVKMLDDQNLRYYVEEEIPRLTCPILEDRRGGTCCSKPLFPAYVIGPFVTITLVSTVT